MRENRDLYYLAAIVDGEIKNLPDEEKLKKEIEDSSELRFEYNIQSLIKSFVSEKLKLSQAPIKMEKKLKKKLKSESK